MTDPQGKKLNGAEDLVQETFLRAFRSWDQYTPGTQCKSWLFTIVDEEVLRHLQDLPAAEIGEPG